jgi:hypothetical protein
MLLALKVVGQPLAGGTAINIVGGDLNEVLFAEPASSLGTRGHRLRQRHRDAGFLAGPDLPALIISAVGHDIERLDSHFLTRLPVQSRGFVKKESVPHWC